MAKAAVAGRWVTLGPWPPRPAKALPEQKTGAFQQADVLPPEVVLSLRCSAVYSLFQRRARSQAQAVLKNAVEERRSQPALGRPMPQPGPEPPVRLEVEPMEPMMPRSPLVAMCAS